MFTTAELIVITAEPVAVADVKQQLDSMLQSAVHLLQGQPVGLTV